MHTHSRKTLRLLKRAPDEKAISFAGGLPAPECIPAKSLEAALLALSPRKRDQCFQYNWTEGCRRLRQQIAMQMTRRGMPTSAEEVLITHGAQQALDILAKFFALRGQSGVIETPTYFPATEAFEINRLSFAAVPRDSEGLDASCLRDAFAAGAQWMYVIPTGHNPTGHSLDEKQRNDLLACAGEFGVTLIEDDVYGELQFGTAQPPLYRRDRKVIHVGSMSKILAPGLRIGWIVAGRDLLQQLIPIKHACDLQTNSLAQEVLSEWLAHNHLATQTSACRHVYRQRRDEMLAALAHYFPEEAMWTHPSAGFSLWVGVPLIEAQSDLLESAMAAGVSFEPGPPFLDEPPEHCVFRLSFSTEPPERIERGIRLLADVLKFRLVKLAKA